MNIRITLFLLTIISCSIFNVKAQSVLWNAGFNGFFDNREYYNQYVAPQTMFGSHVFATGGVAINENQRLVAGFDLLKEFGSDTGDELVKPILYFEHKKDFIDVLMGAFPRDERVSVPKVLLTDTLQYYRPNIEGIFLEAKQSWGYQNAWIDWTSRQTDIKREVFQIGGTGMLKKDILFYRHDFIMTHNAGAAITVPGDNIQDNGGATAGIGLQFSNNFIDSLSVGTGYIFSYDRLRNVYDHKHHGSLSHFYVELYGLALRTSHYFGSGQVLMWGDGLYKAPSYQRFDLIWHVFRNKQVKGKVEFSFHLVDDVLDMSQSFTIYANFNHAKQLR